MTNIKFSGNLFEQAYFNETIDSERLRLTILAGLLGFFIIALLILFSFFHEKYRQLFKDNQAIYSLFIFILFIIAYKLGIRHFLGKRTATFKKPPVFLCYLNAFLEISMPTVLLIIIVHLSEQIIILQGPAVLTYFLFIILVTLRLDFSICLFTGFIAAIEYISISVIYTNYLNLSSTGILANTNILYLGNGVMMIAAGIAAGFVANQIKLKMYKSFKTIQEKNEIVNFFGQQISQQIVDAALMIIDRIKVENEKGLYPQTRIGIGLHSGEAVTGNIGTSLRKQYSITGNVVILASRIEQLNKKYQSQLIIS